MSLSKILLITKLKTTNIGNQALSDEVIKLYERTPENLHVAGRPEGLFGFSIEKLKKSEDALRTFEAWATSIVDILKPSMHTVVFVPVTRKVELLSFNDFKVRNDKWYQRIKDVFRKYVHSDALFAKAYKKRFLTVAAADSIVYSGAGEVGDNNIFLRQLLELRIAQKIGKKTYAINQSVEVVESPMRQICGFVYKQLDEIIVRGHMSRDNLVSLGVPLARIKCFPDSAFLNQTPSLEAREALRNRYNILKPAVGINATKVADDINAWEEIIKLLKKLGYNLYFISNDPVSDKVLGEHFAARHGLIPILEFINYPEYSALLSNFSFVISCRLHTNELALTGSTPVIPIEGRHFKTKEVFNLVNYPIPVTNTGSSNWPDEIKQQIETLHSKNNDVNHFIQDLDSIRKLSLENCFDS
ncbi:polysaccharide pyruvyl transferase family protein [Chryseolinea sp. H1M3-3]|uniref:polysaccharide pyruvyl transferase family protein n=1 Tax=Chryseolinea sp. H1M3-3 TaxID=3034144 RepID=UPI0023EDE4F8|nr:polysaccharide pyruvyl transferase family protein [Chryseolinea sp. H1M3-3]